MPFPSTPLLDSFNRADENPLANGTWNQLDAASSLQLLSNQVAGTAAGTNYRYWNSQGFSTAHPGVEAYVDALPTVLGSMGVTFYDVVLFNGYELDANTAGNVWQLLRVDAGVPTVIREFTQAVASGDGVGLSIVNGVIAAHYRSGASGAWTTLFTHTDGTYTTGFIGLRVDDTTNRADNYGGGQAVAPRRLLPLMGVGR